MPYRKMDKPDDCPCPGCKVRRSREAAKLLQSKLNLVKGKHNKAKPTTEGEKRVFKKSTPKSTKRYLGKSPKAKTQNATKGILTLKNPCVAAKFNLKPQGMNWRYVTDSVHWNFLLTLIVIIGLLMVLPNVRGETIDLGNGHELKITQTRSAILIDSKEYQENLCSSTEYFSTDPLMKIYDKIEKWKKIIDELDQPHEIAFNKVDDFCPRIGGGGSAEDPVKGPFPKLLNHLPKTSPYTVIAFEEKGVIRCAYSFKADFVAGRNRLTNDENGLKRLFPAVCRNQLVRGMIFPKQHYVTYIFKTHQPTNVLSCAELCINQFERAVFNATCSDANQRFFECPSSIPKCHYWSFNRQTNFCLLYLNKQILPHEKKDSKYDKFSDKSGFAFDGLTGPVHCGDLMQRKKLWIRSGKEKNNWIPVKGTCEFDNDPKGDLKVFTKCKESASMMKLFVNQIESRISNFKKSYKLTSNRYEKDLRMPRSYQAVPHNFISPALEKFLISTMTAAIPNMAGFSSVILGPLIGTFLYLTSALITIVVQLALDSQQQVLNKGVIELQGKDLNNLNKEWEIWKSSNLLKVSGFENLKLYDSNFPMSGLANMSEEVESTLGYFKNILEQGKPKLPQITQEIGSKPFTFLALDAGEYIKKIYFFTRTNRKISKLQISVFLSLDQTIPFLEGIVSGSKQTDSPTIQCGDIFRRSQEISKECFNDNSLGSSSQNKFLIGKQLYIFKILGQKVVQIHCPENLVTTFSSGLMVFLASSSCKIHINGNLFFVGEESKLGSFKIILETKLNATSISVPLPTRLQARLDEFHQKWTIQAMLTLIPNILCLAAILIWLIYKAYKCKCRKSQQPVVRYKQPILLPMKNLKPSKFQINDKKEARSYK